jgi:DNA-binding response OmpR family regulator
MPGNTILIVDDDATLRRVLCAAINWFGFGTLEAEDGEQALDIYLRERPCLVITDIYMPKMNGIHLLRTLRRNDPNSKIVLITGGTNYWQLARDRDSRPDGFLTKPFTVTDLMALVRSLISENAVAPSSPPASTEEQMGQRPSASA